jgi:hypothetical protein
LHLDDEMIAVWVFVQYMFVRALGTLCLRQAQVPQLEVSMACEMPAAANSMPAAHTRMCYSSPWIVAGACVTIAYYA